MTKWRFHGHASVDVRDPQAWATCARCGFNYNINDLIWQPEYAGATMINTRLLVCRTCYDKPSVFKRVLLIPPDPDPVLNARPEAYLVDETDWRVTEAQSAYRVTEDGTETRIPETDIGEATQENTD
jgi:hypothetical protein